MVPAAIDLSAATLASVPSNPAVPSAPEGGGKSRGMDGETNFHGELEQALNRDQETGLFAAAAEDSASPSSQGPQAEPASGVGGESPRIEAETVATAPDAAAAGAATLLVEGRPPSAPAVPPASREPAPERADLSTSSDPVACERAQVRPEAGQPAPSLQQVEPPGGARSVPEEAIREFPPLKPAKAEWPAAAVSEVSRTAEAKPPMTPPDFFAPPEGSAPRFQSVPAAAEGRTESIASVVESREEAAKAQIPAPAPSFATAVAAKAIAPSGTGLSPAAAVTETAPLEMYGRFSKLPPEQTASPAGPAAAETEPVDKEISAPRGASPAPTSEAALPERPTASEEWPAAAESGPRELRSATAPGHRAQAPSAAAEKEIPGMPGRAQVFDPIVQRATFQARGGREEIRIELKPDFLGPVRMQIATANQAVSVRILAETPLVRDWIEAGLQQLKSDLEQQGLRVERLEVTIAPDGRQGSDRRESFRHRPSALPAAPAGDLGIASSAVVEGRPQPGPWAPAARRVRLDLFA